MIDFLLFEMNVAKRKRSTWTWRVSRQDGDMLLAGKAPSRKQARYAAYRALFLLLSTASFQTKAIAEHSGTARICSKDSPSGGTTLVQRSGHCE
ncbi:hypothetical protein ACVW1B_003731 [Bradyrhizobium sp. USDA 4502]